MGELPVTVEIVRRRDGGDGTVDPNVGVPHPLEILALALRQGVEELLMRLHSERRFSVLVAARDQAAIRQHDALGSLDVAVTNDVHEGLYRGEHQRTIAG